MSETVKLVIEISKIAYEEMSEYGTDRIDYDIQQMINNGTPLSEVLDEIKAEIQKEIIPRNSDDYDHDVRYQNCGLRIALKIVDKHISREGDK